MYAENAEMSVDPVDEPAAVAVDCMQLFSRIVIGVRAIPMRQREVQIAYDKMQAVIETPNPHPAFNPT
jgi:hypothetical protein